MRPVPAAPSPRQATSSLQRTTHASERRDAVAGLRGCLLNTKTTRRGRSVLDAFPTLLAAADQARPGSGPAGQGPSPGLGASARPSSAPARRSLSGLPSPPPSSTGSGRPPSASSSMSSSLSFYTSSTSSSSRASSSRPASAASSGGAVAGAGAGSGYGSAYGGGYGGVHGGGFGGGHGTPYLLHEHLYEHTGKKPWDTGNIGPVDVYNLTPARRTTGMAWAAPEPPPLPPPPPPPAAAPSSAAVGSVPSGAAGSGSSGLTEAALQLHQRAMGGGVQARHSSLNSSSFRSNRPYAAGWSAQHFGRPHQEHSPVVPVPVHTAWWAHD